MTGAAKDAIDIARSEGEAVGLIKIKTFRPFPLQAMVAALAKVKRIGVVDRSVSFGWNSGPVYQETLAALHHTGKSIPAISFIGGLAGADITVEHFARAIALTREVEWDHRRNEPVWLNEHD
jgi:pyruvate ferredoxin oxidoreductase alpha subunit/phenylglyoxylate dehydrogenase alpha subunit